MLKSLLGCLNRAVTKTLPPRLPLIFSSVDAAHRPTNTTNGSLIGSVVIACFLLMSALGESAYAQNCGALPNTLTNGTNADANQVMANFTSLLNCINSITPPAPGLADVDRQNILLARIYQSKLYGGYRRFVNAFADGYKASNGINAGSSSGYTVNTASGNVAPLAGGNDGFTKSLLAFDGTNGATSATDTAAGAGTPLTWTFHGSAQLSTTSPKFGTASLLVANTTSDYIDTPSNALFNVLGTQAFVVECWVKTTATGATRVIAGVNDSSGSTSSTSFTLQEDTAGTFSAFVAVGSSFVSSHSGISISDGSWHHIALISDGSKLYAAVDGVVNAGVSLTGAVNSTTNKLAIGRLGEFNGDYFNGNIDEFAISVGTTRGWTSNFTPPASAYTSSVSNMTLITTSQTADATVNNGRVLLEYDNTATPTLNTDMTTDVTCNGGISWTSAALSLVSSNGQNGHTIAETTDTSCVSGGTSFAARIKTLTNKNIPIYGSSVTAH